MNGTIMSATHQLFLSFAEEMKGNSNRFKFVAGFLGRLMTGIIYLSFFLVQFDVHLAGSTEDISFFSCDNSTVTEYQAANHARNFEICMKARPIHFSLNKRFHPEKFYEPFLPGHIAQPVSAISKNTALIPEEPLLEIHPGSFSRRGPPALV